MSPSLKIKFRLNELSVAFTSGWLFSKLEAIIFSLNTHKNYVYWVMTSALQCINIWKPYTLEGLEPGILCSWGGRDDHYAMSPGWLIAIHTFAFCDCGVDACLGISFQMGSWRMRLSCLTGLVNSTSRWRSPPRVSRGRCYDHNFLRFLTYFLQKMAFFSRTNVLINFFQTLALFRVKNANIFADFFWQKYFFNHNIGPRWVVKMMVTLD
jgi:hypothetical protein